MDYCGNVTENSVVFFTAPELVTFDYLLGFGAISELITENAKIILVETSAIISQAHSQSRWANVNL